MRLVAKDLFLRAYKRSMSGNDALLSPENTDQDQLLLVIPQLC